MLLLEDLTVYAGHQRVFGGLDVVVRRGESFGACSGEPQVRTAIIDLLLGRRVPDHGRVRVDGLDPVVDGDLLAGRIAVVDPTGDNLVTERVADIWLIDAVAPQAAVVGLRLEQLLAAREGAHPTVLLCTDDPAVIERYCDRSTHLPDLQPNAASGAHHEHRPHRPVHRDHEALR